MIEATSKDLGQSHKIITLTLGTLNEAGQPQDLTASVACQTRGLQVEALLGRIRCGRKTSAGATMRGLEGKHRLTDVHEL